jgi:hypothetical protein
VADLNSTALVVVDVQLHEELATIVSTAELAS